YGGGGEKCALCAKTVYVAERAVAQDKIFHVACFRCKECNVKLTLSSWCMDPCGGLWCKPHFMQALKTSGGTLTIMRSSSFGRFGGGGEKCTRCNKTVYAAERVSAKDQVFHNTCFRCIECNIKLSPSNW
ncbi:hypothetical protein EMIHUDRAFT_57343, partial [Emiliania huxleyi CCMP1516]|uniref:LIM zinc-binding domain-containing protein n=2 Tax=Emiliania huxleyi TaxID=2903 RepID=A0A0D3KVT3_EMIH1